MTVMEGNSFQPTDQTWFGHPKGVFLIALTEFWERFSYYGMLGLLVLFLTAPIAKGGFGWDSKPAILLFGFYSGLAFATPLFGAWLANNYLGERLCIAIGGILLALGHLLLTGPHAIPDLISLFVGFDVNTIFEAADIRLGALTINEQGAQILHDVLKEQGVASGFFAISLTYTLVSGCFYLGLFLIIIGTALIKPTISSIVSRLYPDSSATRDAGFAIFFMFIYIGSISANLIAGFLGEKIGWVYGFGAAGAGMIFGITLYLLKQNAYLGDLGKTPSRPPDGPRKALTRQERERLYAIALQGLFTVIYAAAFYQKGGLLTLFARDDLDRTAFGFTVPVTWLLIISTSVFVALAPASGRLWKYLDQRGMNPSAAIKLAIALGLMTTAYVLMSGAGLQAKSSGTASLLWMVLTYMLFGLADLLVWPIQISLVSKLAPQRYTALCIGGWYLTVGLGTWLSGVIAVSLENLDHFTSFLVLSALTGVSAALLLVLSPLLKRLSHGGEGEPNSLKDDKDEPAIT
ncbi:MAG: peptide MFS transporter [Pseudomonadota bacterium]